MTLDYVDMVGHYQMGAAVHAVFIGNSVACGYNGKDWERIPGISLQNGKLVPDYRESNIPQSAPTMLRKVLQGRNPGSTVVNLCGISWDTNDHLGISTPHSMIAGQTNTIEEIKRLPVRPDVAFIALQINDAGHGLSIDMFTANTHRMIGELNVLGIKSVLVKENYTTIAGYAAFVDKVDCIAKTWKIPVIDTYTPSFNRPELLSDYAHPNAKGHDLIFSQYQKWLNYYGPPTTSN